MRWKVVPGTGGKYEASDSGLLRSLYFINGKICKKRNEPLILVQAFSSDGYRRIGFYINGKQKFFNVSRIILETFVGKSPKGFECAHLNGIKTDNSLKNLRWVTPDENRAHKVLHDTIPRGKDTYNSKLNDEIVRDILRRSHVGESQKNLASEYGVTPQTINKVVKGESWRHIPRGKLKSALGPEGGVVTAFLWKDKHNDCFAMPALKYKYLMN